MRSTRSSPTPPFTGSPITTGSSSGSTPRCAPAAARGAVGGQGNVAEWKRAVESAEGDERFSALPARNSAPRGTSPRSTRPSAARARRLRGQAGLARAQGPSRRRTPGSTCARPGLAKHLERLPRAAGRVRRRGARLDDAAAGARVRRLNISAQAGRRVRWRSRARRVEAPCMSSPRIVLLPGDGIGPEIIAAARRAARRARRLRRDGALGRRAPRSTRTAPRSPTRSSRPAAPPTRSCSARSGAPSGTRPTPTRRAPSRACSACARASACTRTCARCSRARRCCDASPLREERIAGTDLLVVRELTGGIYFGDSGRDGDRAHDDCAYTVGEIERIARVAFDARGARRRTAG